MKYHFSNAPEEIQLKEMIRVSALCWPIELCFQEGKGEIGMDHYEHRSWDAWHRHMTFVFLDASAPLPETIPGFGAPIAVADLAGQWVRLVLVHEGVKDGIDWTPTLAELLSGAPIPPRVAAAWRARLDADKKDKTPLRRLFDFKKEKELRVEAHLSNDAGGETPLGAIAFGGSVKRLVGLGRLDRVGARGGA